MSSQRLEGRNNQKVSLGSANNTQRSKANPSQSSKEREAFIQINKNKPLSQNEDRDTFIKTRTVVGSTVADLETPKSNQYQKTFSKQQLLSGSSVNDSDFVKSNQQIALGKPITKPLSKKQSDSFPGINKKSEEKTDKRKLEPEAIDIPHTNHFSLDNEINSKKPFKQRKLKPKMSSHKSLFMSTNNLAHLGPDLDEFAKVIETSDDKGNIARTVIIKNTPEAHAMFGVRGVPPAPSWATAKETEARAKSGTSQGPLIQHASGVRKGAKGLSNKSQ